MVRWLWKMMIHTYIHIYKPLGHCPSFFQPVISSAEADRARWRKERLGSEGQLPVPQSGDIESSHAPSLFRSGRTAVSASW